jgi:hypothetical protein
VPVGLQSGNSDLAAGGVARTDADPESAAGEAGGGVMGGGVLAARAGLLTLRVASDSNDGTVCSTESGSVASDTTGGTGGVAAAGNGGIAGSLGSALLSEGLSVSGIIRFCQKGSVGGTNRTGRSMPDLRHMWHDTCISKQR